ncbi:MAG: polysaccharide biosynthesis/export family protein [Parvibaculum sp.]|nr:polysaccharide biosynthesis/export family protein [Parvibaculum sp.]
MVQAVVERMGGVLKALLTFALVLVLSGCAGGSIVDEVTASNVVAASAGNVAPIDPNLDYRLGSGDKLRMIVFGEQDLSGEFDVTGTGKVSLPLVGQVQAAGLTLDEFAEEVAGKLKQGYLTNPKISVEVLNFRPFYIIGEVDKPGEYPYTNGMTILNAVAVAGGFTYRANQSDVYITRGGGGEVKFGISQSVRVLPGDIVRIPERFF